VDSLRQRVPENVREEFICRLSNVTSPNIAGRKWKSSLSNGGLEIDAIKFEN